MIEGEINLIEYILYPKLVSIINDEKNINQYSKNYLFTGLRQT